MDKTRRTAIAQSAQALLGPIVSGTLEILRNRSLDADSRKKGVLAQLNYLLKFGEPLHHIVERVHLPELQKTQMTIPEDRRRRPETLRGEARYKLICEFFEPFFMESLRENIPELFRELLSILMQIETLDARRFHQESQRFQPNNSLGYLWAIYTATMTGKSVASCLGSIEAQRQVSTNAEHLTRAGMFLRRLKESLQENDPGRTAILKIRLADGEGGAPAAATRSPASPSERTVVLTFVPGEEQALLDRVVARHCEKHGGREPPAEVLKSIILRLGRALPP